MVHGDLTANIPFVDGQDPAVTDLLPPDVDRASLVARALIFRLVTSDLVALDLVASRSAYLQQNLAAASLVLSVLRGLQSHG